MALVAHQIGGFNKEESFALQQGWQANTVSAIYFIRNYLQNTKIYWKGSHEKFIYK